VVVVVMTRLREVIRRSSDVIKGCHCWYLVGKGEERGEMLGDDA